MSRNDSILPSNRYSCRPLRQGVKRAQKVQKVVFNFLKKSVHMNRNDLQPYFIDLKNNLEKILEDKYERRPTLYLDIISWLESKLTDNTVEEIIKTKRS